MVAFVYTFSRALSGTSALEHVVFCKLKSFFFFLFRRPAEMRNAAGGFLQYARAAVAVIQTNPGDFLSHTSHSLKWSCASFIICCISAHLSWRCTFLLHF